MFSNSLLGTIPQVLDHRVLFKPQMQCYVSFLHDYTDTRRESRSTTTVLTRQIKFQMLFIVIAIVLLSHVKESVPV